MPIEMLTVAWENLKPRPQVSFLIATAVEVERDAVLKVMSPLRGYDRILKVPAMESTYFLGEIGRYPCALVMGEAGSDTRKGSALEIQAGIERWDPLAVIAPGIAFGRPGRGGDDAQIPGDVLVSTQLYPYHHAKITADREEDRGPQPEASAVLLDRIRNLFWAWQPSAGSERKPKLGPLLSGPYVINDATARDNLFKRFPRAIGGEMEGTGLYSASTRLGADWIVIKGVCDWGAEKSDDNQRLAADNSAALLLALLREVGLTAAAFARRRGLLPPTDSGWHEIAFTETEDLRAAFSGDSLGPAHVLACPPLSDVDAIVKGLEEVGSVAVVGPSGSGKSMAAWHAAYRLHQRGWKVYTGGSKPGPLPEAEPGVLLVVDDVQSLSPATVTAALATARRRLLVVSTDHVVGYRRTVHIIPEAAVADLAETLVSRERELLPVLRGLDTQVGEGIGRLTVQQKIEDAKRTSHLPWQFMFNLGSGHLRLDAALGALTRVPPRGTVLFAIAARQLATMGRGADLKWLEATLQRHGIPVDDLTELLNQIGARLALVRVGDRVATPHPQMADRIVTELWRDPRADLNKTIYWEMFDDSSLPLGGLAWLAGQGPYSAPGVPPGLVERILQRCWKAENVGHAGFVLATLVSRWHIDPQRVMSEADQIRTWLSAGVPQHAIGLARFVNELINADHSRSLRPLAAPDTDRAAISTEIVSGVQAVEIASWASPMGLDEGGGDLAELLERLAAAATREWRTAVGASLDGARLVSTVRAAQPNQLEVAAKMVVATNLLNRDLALAMVREMTPALILALRTSFAAAHSALNEIAWKVLSFLPGFLKHGPGDEERKMMAAILEGVGAESFARQLSQARRQEWNWWRNFRDLLCEASPQLAAAVGKAIDLEPLVALAGSAIDESSYEVDELAIALALTDDREPAARFVRRVYVPRRVMTWRGAYMAPDAANAVVEAGVSFPLDLKGGLPRWDAAARILRDVGKLCPDSGRSLLNANLSDLADGLLFRQADGGEGAISFLQVALYLDDAAVVEAFRRVDVGQARQTWTARAKGADEEQVTIREFLTIAKRAGGPIAALASECEKLLPAVND